MRTGCAILLLVCAAVFLAPAQAFGQGVGRRSVIYNRPSEQGASSYIGGSYTQARSFDTLDAPRRDVALLGQDRYQYTRSRNRGSPLGATLPAALRGMHGQLAGVQGRPLSFAAQFTGGNALLAGLGPTPTLNIPLDGGGPGFLPALNAFLYTPETPRTHFQSLFGLTPLHSEPATRRTINSVPDELRAMVAARAEQARRRGLDLLKDATVERRDPVSGRYPNCKDCELKLDEALRSLTTARDLEAEGHLVPLLMAHIALEQERPSLASVYLIEAFKRDPRLFDSKVNELGPYFGDFDETAGNSPTLDVQLRRYVALGEFNPGSPEAFLLTGYCAWRLGDHARVHEAVAAAEQLGGANAEPERMAPVLSFVSALRVAVAHE